MANDDLIRLDQLGVGDIARAGGKGANLGELTRIEGVRVPPGFCVTTAAFDLVRSMAAIDELLDRLTQLGRDGRDEVHAR